MLQYTKRTKYIKLTNLFLLMSISKDIPLAEITLRRYEKPYNLPEREAIRKLCLSIGLLQPGDSRDIIVDILHVLLDARKEKRMLDFDTIAEGVVKKRKDENLPLKGVAPSNIRRQIRRLKEKYLVEKLQNGYRITEYENLSTLFRDKIEKLYLENILSRVREYFERW